MFFIMCCRFLFFLIGLHIWAIHQVGQSNITGIEVQFDEESVPFSPYALIKDIFLIILPIILSVQKRSSMSASIMEDLK